MATKKPKIVLYRRKREQKTDYGKRLKLLTSRKKRLVIRITNHKVSAQIVSFEPQGDKVLMSVNSSALSGFGWSYSRKNIPAAYLTGLLIGKKAQGSKFEKVIVDTGFRTPLAKGRIYAFVKGAVDGGLDVLRGNEDKIFPSEEVISGKAIQDYALKIKDNKEVYEKTFSGYLKNNAHPETIVDGFNKVKSKILG
tara:strand:+ start:332 stop:916 length:585 start_codon:yes stop_codon:yes gene_type:complete